MKKVILIFIVLAMLTILSACSNPEPLPEPPEAPSNSDAQTEQEYDFETLAKAMGYSEDQLSYISGCLEEGLSEKAVLNPLEHSKEFGETYTTSDGKHTLGSFFFDPDIYADYGGPIGFAYLSTEGSIKILLEAPYHLHSYGILDDEHFAFGNSNGINFYRFDDFSSPYKTWNPNENLSEEYGIWVLETAPLPEQNLFAAFVIDIPDNFDNIFNNKPCDTDSTYKLCLLDTSANVTEIDIGVNLMYEFQGLPDVVRPVFLFSDSDKLRFKIDSVYYEYHFENGAVSVFDQNAYLDKVNPLIIKYDEYFSECLPYLICEPSARSFTREQMAAYTYHASVDHNGWLPKELYSESSKNFFGIDLLEFETDYMVSGAGGIVPKNGYSPSPSMFILKELYERSDGSKKAVFYWVGTDFYEPEYIDSRFGGTLPYELIYNGDFAGAARFIDLVEVIFFEHTDKNGDFYIEPISVYNTGSLPLDSKGYVYKSEKTSNDFFEFKVPDISGADFEKLPYAGGMDLLWCINNKSEIHSGWDLFSTYTKVREYTNAVYNVTDHKFGAIARHSFLGLDDADYYSLLYSAVYATPESYYVYEDSDSVYKRIADACGYNYFAVVYGEDVEKTFHYLFGDEIEYVPADLEEFAYRYIPEADIYITYSEYTKAGAAHPIVADHGPAVNNRTAVSVIFANILPDCTFSVNVNGKSHILTKENAKELLPDLTVFTYIFDSDPNGNYILYGIEITPP